MWPTVKKWAAARRAVGGPFLVIAFLASLGVSWVVANPPGYAPDEPEHYLKSVAVGRGQWFGRPARYGIGPGFGPLQLRWINLAARQFDIPAELVPHGFACSLFDPGRSAGCLNATGAYVDTAPGETTPMKTYVGTYEPFLYLPPGLVMNQTHEARRALLAGRAVSAAIAFPLLFAATLVLWSPRTKGVSLVGLLAAATPMVVFLSSALSPTGPEVSATICLLAVFLRLARREPPPRFIWLVAGTAGTVLALGRSLGPLFLVADLLVFLALVGRRRVWQTLRQGGSGALVATVVVVLAITANLAWGLFVQPNPPFVLQEVLGSLHNSVRDIPEVLRQGVGAFGWADVSMPRVAYVTWGVLVTVLVALAFLVGDGRQRLVLALVFAGCAAGTIGIAAAVIHQTHFPMYGRYALPLWVALPLVTGELIALHHDRLGLLGRRVLLFAVPLVVAAVHVAGWYANARRYAVSNNGPVLFAGRSEWAPPPWGWRPWMLLVATAATALVAWGVVAASRAMPLAPSAPAHRAGARRAEHVGR